MGRRNFQMGLAVGISLLFVLSAFARSVARVPELFEGDGLTFAVHRDLGGTWTGTIKLKDQSYPFTAEAKPAAGGGFTISGSFTVDGDRFLFTAEQGADGEISLSSGGTTYRLKPRTIAGRPPAVVPVGGGNARKAALPAELKLKRVDFLDADMGNVVACTMFVPDGWSAQGQVKWSRGDVIFPQKIIELKSPDALKVQFVPAMNFAYVENDPVFVAQMRQFGAPNPPKERDGEPPPDDVGRWLGEFVARKNPAVHNLRVTRDERDVKLEEAFKRAFPNGGGVEMRWYVLAFEYDDDEHPNVRMRDELSVGIATQPPLVTPQTRLQAWSLYVTCVLTAPAERFDAFRPLLNAVAQTLREDPRWWNAKQKTLAAIADLRHRANMDAIAAFGRAIRQAGQTYDQMSDDMMAGWRRNNRSSDEVQRQSVNAINSTEDYRLPPDDPAGTPSVKLPSLYENVYRPKTGDYYILTDKTLESPELTKLEPITATPPPADQ